MRIAAALMMSAAPCIRCVDGIALCETAYGGIVRIDVWQIAAAMEECLHITLLAGDLLGGLHVFRELVGMSRNSRLSTV